MRAPPRLVLPLAVLLAALGSLAGRAPAGEELSPLTDPSSTLAALASKLALSEPDFYDLSEAGVERVQDELSEALRGGGKKKGPPSSGPRQPPPTLLALGAPARVIVEAPEGEEEVEPREELPLLLGGQTSAHRCWEVDPKQNERILVVDLETGQVQTKRAFLTTKRVRVPDPSRSGEEPAGISGAAARIALRHVTDLRKRYDLRWGPGRLAFTGLDYDLRSNTVVVTLVSAKPEAEASPPPTPAARIASGFLVEERQPPALEGEGLALACPAEVPGDEPIELAGRLRLSREDAILAPRAWPRPVIGEPAPMPEERPEDAQVLLATLLVVGLDADAPLQIDLALPVAPGAEGPVEAAFALDLGSRAKGLRGTYQVYLVAGARIEGPRALRVLPPQDE